MAFEKECDFCGELFWARDSRHILCPDCREFRRKSVESIEPDKPAPRVKPAEKTVDSYCRRCIYLAPVMCLETRHRACDYIGATGHRRPCPPGAGCTVRAIKKEKVNNG